MLTLDQCSPEHIIPLALGGINGIEIPVSRSHNSSLGSAIDGAIANDFFILMRRNKFDVRGHSGKRPVFVAKRSSNTKTGAPLQAELDQFERELRVWDPVARQHVADNSPEVLSLNISVKTDIELRFVAKTALSAGYFVYGEAFRENVLHDELRLLMNNTIQALGDRIYSIKTLGDDRFSKQTSPILQKFREMCKAVAPCSIVGLVPNSRSLTTFVGILGEYVGMLNTPAKTTSFPNDGTFRWGHVIVFDRSTGPRRLSFEEALRMVP